MTDMGDAAFLRAFERGEIPNEEFHHTSHLRLALAYLDACGSVEDATDRMATSLRRFAAAAGKADKYHHTITVFWVRMVAKLLDKNLLLAYYSPERLASDTARLSWVEPDRQPIGNEGPDVTSSASDGSARPPGDAPNWSVPR